MKKFMWYTELFSWFVVSIIAAWYYANLDTPHAYVLSLFACAIVLIVNIFSLGMCGRPLVHAILHGIADIWTALVPRLLLLLAYDKEAYLRNFCLRRVSRGLRAEGFKLANHGESYQYFHWSEGRSKVEVLVSWARGNTYDVVWEFKLKFYALTSSYPAVEPLEALNLELWADWDRLGVLQDNLRKVAARIKTNSYIAKVAAKDKED